MSAIERLTITLPADMAGIVKGAVEGGDYASTSEVIREALRDWKLKREFQAHRLAQLKADIDHGMADVTDGRLADLDPERIVAGSGIHSADSAGSRTNRMDRTLRKYAGFAAVKDDEYREWQSLPARARLDAAAELSALQYSWKEQALSVQPRLQRTLVRVQRPPR